MKLLKSFRSKSYNIPLISILFVGFILRFINLGYSDFQGDEIKALYLPDPGQSSLEFLMDQRKGPLQFLITFVLKFFNNDYSNQFLIRLPFALAGFLSVYFFYKLVAKIFGNKIGLFASFFLATNGFFVAFSRIVQYQSFVILFSILALYFIVLANKDPRYKLRGVYLAFIMLAISVLSHYDGLFIAPVFAFYLYKWLVSKEIGISIKHKIMHILISGMIFTIMVAVFYIPFALSISTSTVDYWEGRLSGAVSSKLSSSLYLFTVYQPIYVIHIYTLLLAAGIALVILYALTTVLIKIFKKYKQDFRYLSKLKDFRHFLIGTGLSVDLIPVLIWLVLGVYIWEKVVYIPGTHIYTYLLPLFIALGFGVVFIENSSIKIAQFIKLRQLIIAKDIVLSIIFVFIALQSYAIFVDNISEYPWEEEKFYIWTLSKPTPVFHLSMFGFPYYRDWESIASFVREHPDVPAYSTNERESISRYHVHLRKDADQAGFYIFIVNPQSFTNEILSQKALYWANKHAPVYTHSRSGKDLVTVYLMPSGSLEDLKLQGY
ncbi:hypothetical protein A2619_00370 [candidate division WWE3 bacterium RIFOXYD1_FULL_39_9]|uniref:Glycosyltransferase RgtA/B/C/D-like domain-containing protein n=1 Tax=candidate division WWE3 bacterium RIFOXYD1_FULL_39_9 TaxID=1802649 RepID=A0A1F4X5Z5_UNCKA|nr:MAG: hypothetical protein A2619_00370 [candidate division WWE3 bacterium RIFOXYD1_FULL_39_9]